MATLLQKVKSRMFLFAHRKARGVLNGEYTSVFRGRSLDFDDLRGYIPGDEVRDIDWKASARFGSPLVKRYVAVRKQTVLLVADTGRNMAARALGGEPKRDILVLALGLMGYLALKHGDDVALVYGDSRGFHRIPGHGTEGHLESLLQAVNSATTLDAGASDLSAQLEYVARNYRRRMLLFIVTDEVALTDELEQRIRRLTAQHELLWLTVRDAELVGAGFPGSAVYDVADLVGVPALLARDPEVAREYHDAEQERTAAMEEFLTRHGIALARLGSSDDIMAGLFGLLERHRRAKR
ncbi:MAG: hypothetical protein JWO93_207 [Micrococcaceae bacterium]|nr:hypothetical protein [Micrococcaceae bacterium]